MLAALKHTTHSQSHAFEAPFLPSRVHGMRRAPTLPHSERLHIDPRAVACTYGVGQGEHALKALAQETGALRCCLEACLWD